MAASSGPRSRLHGRWRPSGPPRRCMALARRGFADGWDVELHGGNHDWLDEVHGSCGNASVPRPSLDRTAADPGSVRGGAGSAIDDAQVSAAVPDFGVGISARVKRDSDERLLRGGGGRRGVPVVCAQVVAGRKEPGAQPLRELPRLEIAFRRHQRQCVMQQDQASPATPRSVGKGTGWTLSRHPSAASHRLPDSRASGRTPSCCEAVAALAQPPRGGLRPPLTRR